LRRSRTTAPYLSPRGGSSGILPARPAPPPPDAASHAIASSAPLDGAISTSLNRNSKPESHASPSGRGATATPATDIKTASRKVIVEAPAMHSSSPQSPAHEYAELSLTLPTPGDMHENHVHVEGCVPQVMSGTRSVRALPLSKSHAECIQQSTNP
jgi:hypothetical protein